MIVDATQAIAGIDIMITMMERLGAEINAVTESTARMRAALADIGSSAAGVGVAGMGGSTASLDAQAAAAQRAAAAQTELTDAEKMAAEGARLEAQMAKEAETTQILLRDSSLAAAQAQTALRNAYMATSTGIIKVSDEQKAQMAIQEKSSVDMAAMGRASSKAILGIGASFAVSIDSAMHFNAEVNRLYTAAGLTNASFSKVSTELLKLGNQFGFTGTQMAQAMYHPVSAGLDLASSLKVVAEAANLADIHGAKLEETTYSLSSVMKAYNLSSADAAKTAALLNAIVGEGDMRFNDFNNSIKNWTSTGQTMGISIQSMGAALAYLTDRGNNAEVASTRLTMGLSMVTAGSKAANVYLRDLGLTSETLSIRNKSLQAVMENAGLTTNRIAADLRKPDGIYMALKDLQGAFRASGLSAAEATQVMGKLFGGGRSDKAILALMDNLDGLKTKYAQVGDAVTKYGAVSKQAAQTPQQQWKDFEATVKNLAISFGTILLPGAVAAMHAVAGVVAPLSQFFQQHQTMGKTIGALAAAFGALAIGVKAWAMVANVVKGIQDIAKAIKLAEIATKLWTAATWLFDAAMNANPIGLIVIAIVALVAAVIYAWTHFKGFRDAVMGTWKVIEEGALWLWHNVLDPAWHGIAAGALWLWHNVIEPWGQGLMMEWRLIASVIMWWWHNIVEPAFHAVSIIVMGLWRDWIKPAFGFIAAEFRLVAAIIFWWWRNIAEPAFKGVGMVFTWFYNVIVKPVIDGVMRYLKLLASGYMWLWHNVVRPVFNGIAAVFSWFYSNIVKPMINGAIMYVHFLATAYQWLWRNVVEPVFHGIASAIGTAWGFIHSVFNAMVSAARWVGNTISSIFSWIGRTINSVSGGINSISHMLGFAEGGPVPGPLGAPRLAIVHGGEYVLSHRMIQNITGTGSSNPVGELSTQQVAVASTPSGGGGRGAGQVIVVNTYVNGSLLSQRNLEDNIRTAVLQTNIRNPSNQLSLAAGR